MSTTLEKAVIAADAFRADFVRDNCRSVGDLLSLAVALMQQAEVIFTELGGKRLAAAQFYGAADRMAAPAPRP